VATLRAALAAAAAVLEANPDARWARARRESLRAALAEAEAE
jgi:hypothetical protein